MMRTKGALPKHCSFNFDRHGKRRVRFRNSGFSAYLTGTPWSEDFMRQYAAALDGVKTQTSNIGAGRTIPSSLDALAVAYYRSADFANLKPSTQGQRRNVIEKFRAEHGTKPIKSLSRAHIKAIIQAKAATPEAANHLLKVLSVMLSYAVDQEMIAANPAIGLRKYRSRTDGFHLWSEEEIAWFEERHTTGTKARTGFALMLYTAQRRGDVIRMGWQHINGDEITVTQQKTGAKLVIPLHSGTDASIGIGAANEPHVPNDGAGCTLHQCRFWQLVARPLQ
jgi:hypothetical protein